MRVGAVMDGQGVGARSLPSHVSTDDGLYAAADPHFVVRVDPDLDAAVAPDLAALARQVASVAPRHAPGVRERCGDRGVRAARYRILRNAVGRTERAHH